MIINLLWLILAFILLWIGSGLAVKTVTKISHSLRISSFFVSFFVLGLFTSITEIMVGINAVIEKTPEIYLGNLLGGSVVIFILIIPLLAIAGNGVQLNHSFRFRDLISSTVVVGLPALLTIDNTFSYLDAVVVIILYCYFVFMLEQKSNVVDKMLNIRITQNILLFSFFKIFLALVMVYTGSNILVEQTPKLGEILRISPYVISVLLISIGTNIPELSIAVRSIVSRNNDIAFGNYVGSATLNTLLMGIFSLFSVSPVPANGSNYSVVTFIYGLIIFVYFVKSKNTISRKEGIILLSSYLMFVFFELFSGPGWEFN